MKIWPGSAAPLAGLGAFYLRQAQYQSTARVVVDADLFHGFVSTSDFAPAFTQAIGACRPIRQQIRDTSGMVSQI